MIFLQSGAKLCTRENAWLSEGFMPTSPRGQQSRASGNDKQNVKKC